MGGCPVTVQVAERALDKLEAVDVTTKKDCHPTYEITYKGKIVATTGIVRGSKKDRPLRHIHKDLRVSAQFVLGLARCPKSRDDYLRAIGELKDDPSDTSKSQ